MSSSLRQGFRLGPWKIEPLLGAVTGPNGDSCHLEPKVMDVLICLAEHPHELIGRDQILDDVWSGQVAADDLLSRAISELRHAFHDVRSDPTYIETIPKRGYRLIADVRLDDDIKREKRADRSKMSIHLTGGKLRFLVVTVVVMVLVYFAFDEIAVDPAQEEALTTENSQIETFRAIDAGEKSIAVLPFVNMSDDPGNEYFSDGLSEEILTLLTEVPGLKVIGRTSSFSFKGKNVDLRVVGQMLGVTTVLEGSVRKSGDRVRITVQLVDVSDGTHIWSETYDRTLTDIFMVQDDVASAVIDALQIHVAAYPTRGRPTENPEAYALFLKSRVSTQDLLLAKELVQQAIELDPKFAEAYEWLAYLYWMREKMGVTFAEAQKLMGEAGANALAIDPDLVLAQALYRSGSTESFSFLTEIEAFDWASRQQPANQALLHAFTWDLIVTGYLKEAASTAERFVNDEPLWAGAHNTFANALNAVGRTSEALSEMKVRDTLQSNGGNRVLNWEIGHLYLAEKQDDNAIDYMEAWLRQHGYPDSNWVRELVAGARDPVSGQAYLDRRIPQIIASMPKEEAQDWQWILSVWYLLFGFHDRHVEVLLTTDLTDSNWSDGAIRLLWRVSRYQRLGFTANPKYLEVVESLGIIDVWERRGPPDFCEKMDDDWVCE